MYKATPVRPSAETLQTRREWHNIFKVIKEEKFQPRILYVASPSAHRSAFKERDKTSKC